VELTNPGDLPEEKTRVSQPASALPDPVVRTVPDTKPGGPRETPPRDTPRDTPREDIPSDRRRIEVPTDPDDVAVDAASATDPHHQHIATEPDGMPAVLDVPYRGAPAREAPLPETRQHTLPPPPLRPTFSPPARKNRSGVLLPLLVFAIVAIGTVTLFLIASH
jgi:hypothetical protein